jgi:hypothetical protein
MRFKQIIFALLSCLLLLPISASSRGKDHSSEINSSVPQDWLSSALEQIKGDEYKPTLQDEDYKGDKLQNPKLHFTNRANNLRVYIDESGIELMPRIIDDENKWNVKIETILVISNGSSKKVKLSPQINGNLISSISNLLDLECLNSEEGLILSLSIKKQVDVLKLDLEKELSIIEERNKIVFQENSKDKMYLEINELDDNREEEISYSLNIIGNELRISLENKVLNYPLSLKIKITSKSLNGNKVTSHPFAEGKGLSETPDWIAESDQAYAYFGYSVSGAGDVNGDGYSDVIVGAWGYDHGQAGEGRAFVYHGSASGLSTSPDWTAESDLSYAYFGNSVSQAGDVNGDGYSDIIVGAPLFYNGQSNEGGAFVYHGSPSGLSSSPDWTAESDQELAEFGRSVSQAGDVNGDGYSDIIVGAPEYDHGEMDEGGAFIYHGSSSGLSISPDWTAESNQEEAFFGVSVSQAGDVNGDGYSDVIVGAWEYDHGEMYEGCAFVYYGSSSGLSTSPDWTAESDQAYANFGFSVSQAGDVNGDGYSDVIVGAPWYDNGQEAEGSAFVYHGSSSGLSTSPGWTGESNQIAALFGNSVSHAGDVNGDGYSDVIVGAYGYDHGQIGEGGAFVYHGSSSGLSTSPDWTAESDQGEAFFGISVSQAGDVNGDGYSDVIVGAYWFENGQTNEGGAFVYHGSSSGVEEESSDSLKSFIMNVTPAISNQGFKLKYYISGGEVPSKGTQVSIRVYDKTGRLIKTIFNGRKSAGLYEAEWNGDDDQATKVPSGVYFIYLKYGEHRGIKKAIFIR